MPLPDERPRQSVANLIGRFEQKRQSLSGITPPLLPRSTSVASHTTGDSVKEEIREKREWPPRSTIQDEKPKITLPSSSILRPPASQPTSPPIRETAAPPAKPATEDPAPAPASESVNTSKPATASAKSPPVRKPISTPVKTPTPKASSTAKRSPVRSPPPRTTTLTASNSQPLRPQHTGTSTKSVTSPPSSVRHIKPNSKSAQSTPNRSKTPASSHTPRPKTPGSTPTSRPKTPSGLFAPTAASLAKARNAAAPAVPTPIKKATLSSSAAERLSKPTAASISKVRTPSLPGTSPSRGKVAARGGATQSTIKPRVGLAPARMKEMAAKKNGNGVKVAEAATALGSEVVGGHDGEQLSDEEVENGHDLDASGFLAESETGSFADESVEVLVTEPEDEPVDEEEPSAEVVLEGTELSLTASPDISSSPTLAPEDPSHELEAASEPETEVAHPGDTSTEPHQDLDEPGTPRPALGKEHPAEAVKSYVQAGADIHDIVNLLETTSAIPGSKIRPLSIPDDAPDIPDEE